MKNQKGYEWKDHKYIDKIKTKTGKIRYIYPDDIVIATHHNYEPEKNDFEKILDKYKEVTKKKFSDFKKPEVLVSTFLTGNPLIGETMNLVYNKLKQRKAEKEKEETKESPLSTTANASLKSLETATKSLKTKESPLSTTANASLKSLETATKSLKTKESPLSTTANVFDNQPNEKLMKQFNKRVDEKKRKRIIQN